MEASVRTRRQWLPWVRADGRVAGRAYGRDESARVSVHSSVCPVGRKSTSCHQVRVCLFSLERDDLFAQVCACMVARINVAEGAEQLMGLDLMRDGECAEAATEAEWPAKHRQLPFTFKSHKITALTPSSRWRSSAPLLSALFSFSVLFAVAQKLGIFIIAIVVRVRAVIDPSHTPCPFYHTQN